MQRMKPISPSHTLKIVALTTLQWRGCINTYNNIYLIEFIKEINSKKLQNLCHDVICKLKIKLF